MTAVVQPVRRKISLEEFRALPEGPPYYELERGELILTPLPHGRHQEVLAELLLVLRPYVKAQKLGRVWPEIKVELAEDLSYGPDLVYLSNEHLDRYDEDEGLVRGSPDLVVEIVSHSSVSRDRIVKFNNYLAAGVPWYWIVDPHGLTIEEYQATPEGYLRTASAAAGDVFRPRAFPGLELDLQALL